MSLIVHSQQDTDSVVVLTKKVATQVLKDLGRLDYMDSLNVLNRLKMDKYVRQLGVQDRVIIRQQEYVYNLKSIIVNKDSIIGVNESQTLFYKKQSKKQKRQKILVGGVGLGLLVILFVFGN